MPAIVARLWFAEGHAAAIRLTMEPVLGNVRDALIPQTRTRLVIVLEQLENIAI